MVTQLQSEMFDRLIDIWKESGGRYHDHKETSNKRDESLAPNGDWREVESGNRLSQRLLRKGHAPSITAELVSRAKKEPQFGNVLLERIIADSELLDVTFLTVGAQLARNVARIQLRSPSGRVLGHGTGFMVSPTLLMTNNHVLRSTGDAANAVAQFDFFTRPDGSENGSVDHEFEPGIFFKTDRTLDFSLVAVAPESRDGVTLVDRPWNQLIRESGKALVDRLTHHVHILEMNGESYRLKNSHKPKQE